MLRRVIGERTRGGSAGLPLANEQVRDPEDYAIYAFFFRPLR
jgi:hypothetical protein